MHPVFRSAVQNAADAWNLPEKRVNCSRSAIVAALSIAAVHGALAQTTQPSNQEIDACGTLVQVGRCVLFSGAGGNYVLADYGDFKLGDAVRVVGTISTDCQNICAEADGCIQGAVVYDPAIVPCGTPIADLETDLAVASIDALGTGASAAIGAAGLVGMAVAGRGRAGANGRGVPPARS